jgi:DNA-binding GntR family transcriptional regulator
LSKTTETVPDAAGVFDSSPDQSFHVIRRRRAIDGHPVLIERIVVHPDIAPGLLAHDLDQSLTQVLKTDYGVSVARNQVTMRPCSLVRDEAAALGVKPGTPGFMVERTSFSADGKIVEYDHEYWRRDAFVISFDLSVV